MTLFNLPDPPAPLRPFEKPCGHPGPFYVPSWTPKGVRRLVVLTCTRPKHDPEEDHYHADPDARIMAVWSSDGAPVYPRPLPPRRIDDADNH